jgi:hypothetical protein
MDRFEPVDLQAAWKNRDRVKEAEDRAAARAAFFEKKEIACLTARAWMYIKGEMPPTEPILEVACGRKDTQRFIGWSDVELLKGGHPMLYEVTCKECFKLWDTFARRDW